MSLAVHLFQFHRLYIFSSSSCVFGSVLSRFFHSNSCVSHHWRSANINVIIGPEKSSVVMTGLVFPSNSALSTCPVKGMSRLRPTDASVEPHASYLFFPRSFKVSRKADSSSWFQLLGSWGPKSSRVLDGSIPGESDGGWISNGGAHDEVEELGSHGFL